MNEAASLWLVTACAAALVVLFVSRHYWRRMTSLDWRSLATLLVAAHFAGLMFAQWRHATGSGQLSFRYFVPALLSISLFLAAPAVAWTRVSGWLVAGLSALGATAVVMSAITHLDRRHADIALGEGSWMRLLASAEANGISRNWVWAMLGIMAMGIVIVGWVVGRADGRKHSTFMDPDGEASCDDRPSDRSGRVSPVSGPGESN